MILSFFTATLLCAPDFTLHEWGTFTSVAGDDGKAITWRPLASKSDLPSFVYTIDKHDARGECQGKHSHRGTIRMETPVIYFYASEPTEVSLSVTFNGGLITEWYPWSRDYRGSTLDWGTFKILPDAKVQLPREPAKSHYYPAREVDAAAVQVCSADGEPKAMQHERFLFYRGVGTFEQPLRAKPLGTSGSEVELEGVHGDVLLFARRGNNVGLRKVTLTGAKQVVSSPLRASKAAQAEDLESAQAEVLKLLLGSGLYEKEAKAMLETWKNTWFEEGLRAMYLVPREVTDAVLPLKVAPAPKASVRVLVGRLELLTGERVSEARRTLMATKSLATLGRFGEPLARRALLDAIPSERAVIEPLLEAWGRPGAAAVE